MSNLENLSNLLKRYEADRNHLRKDKFIDYDWDDFFHTNPSSIVELAVRDFCLELARKFPGEDYAKGRSEYYSPKGFSILLTISDIIVRNKSDILSELQEYRENLFHKEIEEGYFAKSLPNDKA